MKLEINVLAIRSSETVPRTFSGKNPPLTSAFTLIPPIKS